MILKTGTHIIDPRPKINIMSEYLFPSSLTGLSLILPLNTGKIEATPAAAAAQAIEGINKYCINIGVETLSPIQSIVVVTSPIGDQAPPALAATTIRAAYQILNFLSETTFCKMEIKTIVAVRLSIIADKIKANPLNTHKIAFFVLKFIIF